MRTDNTTTPAIAKASSVLFEEEPTKGQRLQQHQPLQSLILLGTRTNRLYLLFCHTIKYITTLSVDLTMTGAFCL
jgi:hypothetical protein